MVSATRRRRLWYPDWAGSVGNRWHRRLRATFREPAVAWDPHDRLGDTQAHDLRIGQLTPSVATGSRQEIVGCAINGNAESVEVGVHRGLQVDGVLDTADFGLSVLNPFTTAIAVESII
jgi:hypothetical protein